MNFGRWVNRYRIKLNRYGIKLIKYKKYIPNPEIQKTLSLVHFRHPRLPEIRWWEK